MDAKGAAYFLHENNHDEEIDKKDTGGGFSSIWSNLFQETERERERALKKKEENNIDADTGLLKRCEGDLMSALEVLGGAYVVPFPPSFLLCLILLLISPSPPSPPCPPLFARKKE